MDSVDQYLDELYTYQKKVWESIPNWTGDERADLRLKQFKDKDEFYAYL